MRTETGGATVILVIGDHLASSLPSPLTTFVLVPSEV